ncbi:hypothetical protein [Methanoregula sp.]|uniref:hypothetical protein n=1 Tax=Methanoregula sp. TaxID=2052170 RepID=UPI003C710004
MNKRDFDRFGIQILQDEGFEVTVWDLTPCLHPGFYSTLEIPDRIDYRNLHIFERKADVLMSIAAFQDTDLAVCLIGFDYNSRFFYRAFSQHHIRYCVWQAISLPVSINPDTAISFSWRKFLKKIAGMRLRAIGNHVVTRLMKKHYRLFGVRPATIAMLAGERSDDTYFYPIDKTTKKLWLHLLDYDIYLEQRQQADRMFPGRYAVFLDEYLPFHPDYKYIGVEPPVSADEYYPGLCSFFAFLEKKYDLRVIIAAHPRSKYDAPQEYFGDRTVFRGKTAGLVRDAEFVIAHMSTAIDFAVLFNKPLIFVTNDILSRQQDGLLPFGRYIDTVAAAFHKKPVNIDAVNYVDWDEEMNVDPGVYQKYRNAFIKKDGTPELPFWKIVADYIHTL